MTLPIYQIQDKDLMILQTKWAQQINPVLAIPFNSNLTLKDVVLVTGQNVINHKLGRKLQGWVVSRMKNSFVQLFDTQDTNQMADKTLLLNSSGDGLIDLIVF